MPLDTIAVLSPLDRATDDDGAILPGATLSFFEAGTSTPLTVYSDANLSTALGSVVTCDAGGFPTSDGNTPVTIYTGSASYKLVVKDAAGVVIRTLDNLKGAPVIPDTATAALPETPVISRTSTYQVLATDKGKLINADPTGGSFAVTLPSAVTVGDKWRVGVRHNGAATGNVVAVRSTGGQTIGAPGQSSATSISLTGLGMTYWLVSNGAGWVVDTAVPPVMGGPLPFFKVTDRLAAPPVSPTGGNRYIINGTPTGVWATLSFAEKDVVESDGNGSWLKYTPQEGMLAYIEDENLYSAFIGTAWTDLSNISAPQASTLGYAVFAHDASDGTNGGQATTGAWTTRVLNTERVNTIDGAALASNVVTLPTGKYLAIGTAYYEDVNTCGLRILQGASTAHPGVNGHAGAGDFAATLTAMAVVVITDETDTLTLQYYAQSNTGNTDLGRPLAISGNTETYAQLTIIDLSSLQGPQGAQGPQGHDGLDAAFAYQWSTATAGDPGSGKIRGNDATIASITQIAISETNASGGAMADVLANWGASTSVAKGTLKITKEGAEGNFHLFRVTAAGTDAGSYRTFDVTYVGASGTISDSDDVAVLFVEKGDIGDPGVTLPDISDLTEDTANDDETDYLIEYDASAGSHKKVKPKNLGFTQAGTGAVLRRLQEKLRDVVDGRDFGMSPSASAAVNRAGLQAAIDTLTSRGRLVLPPKEFDINGSITSSLSNITIEGPGKAQCFLTSSDLDAPIFAFSGDQVKLKGVGLNYSSTPTSGADAIQMSGEYGAVEDVWVLTSHRAIVLSAAHGTDLHDLKLTTFVENGILADGVIGGRWSRLHLNASDDTTHGTLGCIRLVNSTEALQLTNIETLLGLYSVTTDASGSGFGNVPAYHHWINCIFDAAGRGSILKKMSNSVLANCWFSGGRTDSGYDGVVIDECSDLLFTLPTFVNCGAAGARIKATSSRIKMLYPNAGSNSVTAGSGVNDGIEVEANADDITILYPTGGNSQVPGGQQGYDVSFAAGTGARNTLKINSAGGVTGVAVFGPTGVSNYAEINGAVYQSGLIAPLANGGADIGASGQAWLNLFLGASGKIDFDNGDVTITHSANALSFAGASSGYSFDAPMLQANGSVSAPSYSFTGDPDTGMYWFAGNTLAFSIGGSRRTTMSTTAVYPGTNDGLSLGLAANSWSDLFLASEGRLNWNNGNLLAIHRSGGLDITANSSALPSPISDAVLRLSAANSTSTILELDSFTANAQIVGRGSRGSAGTPSATQVDDVLIQMGGQGYGATGYSAAPRAIFRLSAAANWTDASQGTYMAWLTTAIGSTTQTERMRLTDVGNLKIGGTAARGTTEGTNQLVLFDGTAPAGTLANGVSLYSDSGELRSMDAAGNSTLLSPHDKETNEWIYDSVDTRTGRRLRINMERMMRAINEMHGWDFVHEFSDN